MSDGSESTQSKRIIGRPFQPGNPGRPKGARNRLQEDFLKDVQAAWEAHGEAAIKEMIADKPGDFVKMVASLMPKEATLNINDHSEMTDDELTERVRQLAAQLSPFLLNGDGDAFEGTESTAGTAISAKVH